MKKLLVLVGLLLGCATVGHGYAEMDQCPALMTEEQRESGIVRCRSMCSSYARDFAEFDAECKCRCAPATGGGYRPKQQFKVPRQRTNET